MYQIERKILYSVYDRYYCKWIFLGENKELIYFLRRMMFDYSNYFVDYYHFYDINFSSIYNNYDKFNRRYLFVNNFNKTVNIKSYYEQLIKQSKRIEKKDSQFEYKQKLVRHNVEYKFRYDPVPFVRTRRYSYNKRPKIRRIISTIKNPEYKEFNRNKKYEDLIDYWDDERYKDISRSWKNKKKKHQWE